MRAIIKKTGEIVDVYYESQHGSPKMTYKESVLVNSRMWAEDELELITNNEDDKHWQNVKERAAIAALQGLLANPALVEKDGYDLALTAKCRAVQLVERLKKEE